MKKINWLLFFVLFLNPPSLYAISEEEESGLKIIESRYLKSKTIGEFATSLETHLPNKYSEQMRKEIETIKNATLPQLKRKSKDSFFLKTPTGFMSIKYLEDHKINIDGKDVDLSQADTFIKMKNLVAPFAKGSLTAQSESMWGVFFPTAQAMGISAFLGVLTTVATALDNTRSLTSCGDYIIPASDSCDDQIDTFSPSTYITSVKGKKIDLPEGLIQKNPNLICPTDGRVYLAVSRKADGIIRSQTATYLGCTQLSRLRTCLQNLRSKLAACGIGNASVSQPRNPALKPRKPGEPLDLRPGGVIY